MTTTLTQIPVLDDNTVWALERGDDVVVVDPGVADPVLAFLARRPGRRLRAVLCTHHHEDHTGGNRALCAATGCDILGASHDAARIPGLTRGVAPGVVSVHGFVFRVLDVRAHTRGHIAYAWDGAVDVVVRHGHGGRAMVRPELAGRPALFVGDALFGAGCGRLFEGDGEDLFRALSTLAAEDPRALVSCAHEYTAENLAFARAVFPEDDAIAARAARLSDEMAGTDSSLPSTLALERATNPFLRALREPDPVRRVFDLRRQKDSFQP